MFQIGEAEGNILTRAIFYRPGEARLDFRECGLHILRQRSFRRHARATQGHGFLGKDNRMPGSPISRRRFALGLSAAGRNAFDHAAPLAADFRMRQYHNQPTDSPLHKRLTQMWDAVKAETHGRVQVEIFPENNHFKEGDPDPLDLLIHGGLEF